MSDLPGLGAEPPKNEPDVKLMCAQARQDESSISLDGNASLGAETPEAGQLAKALHHLRAAIDLLDDAKAPGHIAAHADLAASQVEALIPAGLAGEHGDGQAG